MRVIRRRLSSAELDAELLGLAVLAVTGGLVVVWLMLRLPTPVCMFHAITGIPCLTCGGTRSIKNLLSGHVGAALSWNPFVFFAMVAAGFFMVYAAVVTAFKLPRIRAVAVTAQEANLLRGVVIFLAAANWIYLIFRFSHAT